MTKKKHPKAETGAMREKLHHARYDHLPALEVNEAFAEVAEHGAKKYDVDNWRKGLPISQLAASAERHLWAFMSGEDVDKDSGLPHVSHFLWNACAMAYFHRNGLMDDRFENRKGKENG